MGNVSQFRNHQYKGPAPMVLGVVQGNFHYCGKPGHFKRECFKYKKDLAAGKAVGRSRNVDIGGPKQFGGGPKKFGGGQVNNLSAASGNINEVIRLGLAAMENK